MATYKDLIETVIKREFGILGKERMMDILSDMKMKVNGEGLLSNGAYTIKELEALVQTLHDKYGAVAVMGCKVAVGRAARDNGLDLPSILK
ncbi:MAG: hypothetical protein HY280_07705 [Nitrospinae bacterium]|nr:hypothetical protein [Nitrospinota bacterium]